MPPIRSSTLACCFKLVSLVLSLGKIMPTCSCYSEKGLVCIAITAFFSYQSFSYAECTRVNMQLSYNIYLVFNTKCIFILLCYWYLFSSSQLRGGKTR